LASTLGTHTEDVAAIGDALDTISVRPDFMILISPVITLGEHAHQGSVNNLLGDQPSKDLIQLYSNELQVTDHTPPAFIVHAQDDPVVPYLNSLLFFQALTEHGVVASLHIFPQGQHAIALRNNPGDTNYWTQLCEAWLQLMGFI
ncbi:MAG: prolyl oligopeptidase family serine peptidase, partial [Lewinella sp.]|nr:prolyl oligopeptidase family serine peptidase [Lewinella sp.]